MKQRRKLFYMELQTERSRWARQQVHKVDGYWMFRAKDVWGRSYRFDPKTGHLEIGYTGTVNWHVCEEYTYDVQLYDSDGNELNWEE